MSNKTIEVRAPSFERAIQKAMLRVPMNENYEVLGSRIVLKEVAVPITYNTRNDDHPEDETEWTFEVE